MAIAPPPPARETRPSLSTAPAPATSNSTSNPTPSGTRPRTENESGRLAESPPAAAPVSQERSQRLLSLDAYRGFIMLAMASSGLGFAKVAKKPEVLEKFADTSWNGPWRFLWETLGYQFDHVAWTGCAFWDLIQPSFMFMVGVAMPFSNARRQKEGQSLWVRFLHVLWRSAVLILLGVFLSSNGAPLTNFTFVNVLTQIGLGYAFLYLLSEKTGRRENLDGWLRVQFGVACVILIGYGAWFAFHETPADELEKVQAAILAKPDKTAAEWSQFEGFAAHWNKHTNAAAAVDRKFLNVFPRAGEPFEGRKFWVNDGGYQTLNFIPSLATMIFGLMAGTVLRSDSTERQKLRWLLLAGLLCFVVTLPIDTTLWPKALSDLGASWSLCPAVKRIWTPTWAVFSSGWTLWILAAFYWIIDLQQWRRWAWPLAVVGVNSITMYCMSQVMRPFVRSALKTHLATVDAWLSIEQGCHYYLFSDKFAYQPICELLAILFVFWLVCLWLFWQKIFVRI